MEVTTIVVPDPGPGEAVVCIQSCGVCHTDLHYREGGINDDFPFLLGHEAAGVVESVGPDVTGLEPGDFVVLNWRADMYAEKVASLSARRSCAPMSTSVAVTLHLLFDPRAWWRVGVRTHLRAMRLHLVG